MKKILKFAPFIFILFLAVGFRISPGKWKISRTDPTIWVKLCGTPSNIETNDITENDPLRGINGLTMNQVLQSVIDDYNNVPTSYLRLAMYPSDPNNPGAPAAGDSTFTIATAEKRTIEICFGETSPLAGLSGGYAEVKRSGDELIGCKITARPEVAKKARFLTHMIAHELGHCFGLQHPQESMTSVMSYFNQDDVLFRLQNDDLAGITFKYPDDDSYAEEAATFGLKGCAPRSK